MNTKMIGNIGEAKVLSKFVELGYPVYIPFGDNERCDIIVEFNGKLNKIQVKTSLYTKNDSMVFSICSSTRHRKNGKIHYYTKDEIDYFACYSIERDVILLISIDDVPKNKITFRCEKPKNNQKKGIRLEKDYLIESVLSNNI